jgi:hypothetical protein
VRGVTQAHVQEMQADVQGMQASLQRSSQRVNIDSREESARGVEDALISREHNYMSTPPARGVEDGRGEEFLLSSETDLDGGLVRWLRVSVSVGGWGLGF